MLAEIDHLVHAPLRVFHLPEVMHYRGHPGKKPGNQSSADLRFDPGKYAGPAHNQGRAAERNRQLRSRNLLLTGVIRQAPALGEVMNPVIKKESAKDQT